MAVHVPGLIRRLDECNTGQEQMSTMTPFICDGQPVGRFRHEFAQALKRFPEVFTLGRLGPSGSVTLAPELDSPTKRTAAVAGVLEILRAEGVVTGWRDELYPVKATFHSEPVLLVERAAAAHFGIKAYGVHINGYVEAEDGSIQLWVARRSKTKQTWPGMLDHLAAGGQPHGLSCYENVVKECGEEASVPPALARRARPAGAVSYVTVSEAGYKPDILFCYDLRLPADFVPKPLDGEVEEFMLWPLEAVAAAMTSDPPQFKTNVPLVIVDFMVRHGFLTPEMPGYLDLVNKLRSGDCC